jgi:hypothetical protein
MGHIHLPLCAETPPLLGKAHGPNRKYVGAVAESSFTKRGISHAVVKYLKRFDQLIFFFSM